MECATHNLVTVLSVLPWLLLNTETKQYVPLQHFGATIMGDWALVGV